MDQFKKAFLNVRESVVRLRRAQTITRSLAWGAYNHMGHDIGSMASGIDSNRASATGRSCRFFTFESNGRGGSGESGNWRGRRDRELPTSRFVYAQHFQPEGMLIGLVPFQVGAFHLSLLPIPLGEIDQARALRAEHVHTQA